ncbi:MAG TPA: hypothetical protein DCZ92_08025 [Elusimicrobia bacterium]|nr:MAG: hypothetical protein A2016_06085 [Elusimicrobia bacterium GWF2_62_30]HBA60752.1 hypothetical protein [Elusimicrobiota bacterium]
MILSIRALSTLAFSLALFNPSPAACADAPPVSVFPPDLAALAASAPAVPAAGKPAAADWTVLYFINGKNNLESSALMDMNQLELVGSTEKVKIVVEMGRMNGQHEGDDHAESDWTGVRRYLVTKDQDTNLINSPVLMQRAKYDMGDWKELAAFINWAKRAYPARRYALVLWDHGNGWMPVDPVNAHDFDNIKGFSLDDETGHEFSTIQIGAALKASGGVNFLMLDGCNMQMASVAYELKDYAEALTASEEFEPGVLVRYAQFLGMLNAKPWMGAEEFAANTVSTYGDFFEAGGYNEGAPMTQSALRLSQLVPFRAKLDAWAAEAVKAEPRALRHALKKARIYGDEPSYKDLYDFVELVGAATANQRLKALGAEVMRSLKSDLVISNWAQDKVSHGLAIYIPQDYDPLYDKLAWSRDGAWDDFAKFIAANYKE